MPRRFSRFVPQLVQLAGYVLACAFAASIDPRLVLGVLAAIAIYEAREAQR